MNRANSCNVLTWLAAGALTAASFVAPVSAAEELRIGFIAPKSGIFAQLGTDMQNGLQMYLDEHDGELGGAKVTMIVEDDQGKPDTGVTKANKLILSDKVNMLVGGVLATTGHAREDALHRLDRDRRRPRPARLREVSLHGAADLRAVAAGASARAVGLRAGVDRKSTRLNSSH